MDTVGGDWSMLKAGNEAAIEIAMGRSGLVRLAALDDAKPTPSSALGDNLGGGDGTVIPNPGYRPAGEANLIVVITATYARPSGKSQPQPNLLLRMRNMLCSSHGHQFLWLLVMSEADYNQHDPTVLIPKCEEHHTSLVHHMGVVTRAADNQDYIHRGMEQQNAGFDFIRDPDRFRAALRDSGFNNVDPLTVDPMVYIADDDNEYDPLLWDEIARVKRVGVWPVGTPFVNVGGLLRSTTGPMSNLLLLSSFAHIYEGESCFDLGRMRTHNDSHARHRTSL